VTTNSFLVAFMALAQPSKVMVAKLIYDADIKRKIKSKGKHLTSSNAIPVSFIG